MEIDLPLTRRHGLIRDGFALTTYSDRPANRRGGLLHGWGPLDKGYHNPYVDMIFLTLPWSMVHEQAEPQTLKGFDRQIDLILEAGKKVYLYPHPAFPPQVTGIGTISGDSGWIDYFDDNAHTAQVAWVRWISQRYGRDKRISAIRMSSFQHGEAWVTGRCMEHLRSLAHQRGCSVVEAAEPYLRDLYRAFLSSADPHRLVAHGGGLQGTLLQEMVQRGTGHANGTMLLDLGGAHQYPRPEHRQWSDGHLLLPSLEQCNSGAIYCAERQTGEAWLLTGEAFDRWFVSNLCIAITHRVNYLMLNECVYNAESYRRISECAPVSPDATGRLTRRQEESASRWRHREDVLEAALWARSLLGTDSSTTPEAFVQMGRHYVGALSCHLEALEHGMTLDLQQPGIPTCEFDLAAGAEFQRSVLGHRRSTFARRTDHASGSERFCFTLDAAFQHSLIGRRGELLEVRVTYLDEGFDEFGIRYPGRDQQIAETMFLRMTNSGLWLTACFLIVDPAVVELLPFAFELAVRGSGELTVSLVRAIKQWD